MGNVPFYSSIKFYTGKQEAPEWLSPQKILNLFDGIKEYQRFVNDYEESMRILDELKHQLADS